MRRYFFGLESVKHFEHPSMNKNNLNWINAICLNLTLFAAALCPGCSTFVAYSGPTLPDTQVATLRCYWRYYLVYIGECHVSAIDGRRPGISQIMGITSKLAPGNHWVEFGVEQYFGGGGGKTDVCAFDFDFEAGYQYQIKAHSLEFDVGWMAKHSPILYAGSVVVEATSPGGQSQAHKVNATCSFGGGSFCRETSDCVPHPDIRCFPQEGHSFGKCGFNK
jgi:hypothetical protein